MCSGHPRLSIPHLGIPSDVAIPANGENWLSTLSGQTFALTFSRVTGNLTIWFVNGHSLLERDPTTKAALSVGCWRPPTNNDVPFDLAEWRQLGIDSLTNQLRYLETVRLPDGTIQVNSKAFICALILAWGFLATSVYTVSREGTLRFSTQDTTPNMPIADALDNATWFGRSPGESYADKKMSQKMGI
ncbi:galactose mutarotase-like domain-containing protein [Lipomyces doorenjongii]|uniref:galactose mutarotase-like domain-containing protein n=1 Tax=Lipomyces doorenjongii TaxID=383834 RepID=UPI0034CD04A6